ncbi:MAG TPA: APC family permease [Steroidobacteraceae bacterium]|nr:APC family permease [Steroidobacteraceae bacterium]
MNLHDNPSDGKDKLKRSLTVLDLAIYGLMFISPTATFSGFGIVFDASDGMVPLVYVIGFVAMLFTAVSYTMMSREFPSAGSVYAYSKGSLGEGSGFLAGWAMVLDYLLAPALIYIGAAVAVGSLVPQVPLWLWGIALLIGNTLINLRGIRSVARANNVIMLLQVAVLVLFFVMGTRAVVKGVGGAHLSVSPFFKGGQVSLGLVAGAVSLGVLNYMGFDAISTLAEEAKGGAAAVGRATMVCLFLTGTLFVAESYLASLFVLGRGAFPPGMPTYAAFYDIAHTIGGWFLESATSMAGLFVSCIAAALAAQAAISRLLFSMARDGKMPAALAHVSAKSQIPDRATIFVAIITAGLIAVFSSRLTLLVSIVSFGALIGFLFLHASVIAHFFWRKGSKRWLAHLVSPAIGFAIIAYVIANMSVAARIVGGCWFAFGAAWLIFRTRRGPIALPGQ